MRLAPLLLTLAALTACGDPEPAPAPPPLTDDRPATLTGRLDDDAGNQHLGPAAAAAPLAADIVALITFDGAVVAEAPVDAGRYHFPALAPLTDGAYVEARHDGRATGRALVPGDLRPGADRVVMPISAETTAEAAAHARLWSAHGGAVDPVALVTHVSAPLAAALPPDALAAAAWAAQRAERAALAAHLGERVTAAALLAARGEAYDRLAARVDAAQDGAAPDAATAWATWHIEAAAAVATLVGADAPARADAAAAAGVALVAALRGGAGEPAAAALAAELAARAEHLALRDRIRGHAAAEARLRAAFERFHAALAAAPDAAAVTAARAALLAALGLAPEARADSVLHLLVAAEGGALAELIPRAAAAVTAAATTPGPGDGAAFTRARAALRAAIHDALAGHASPPVVAFVAELALAAAAHPAVAPGEDLDGAALAVPAPAVGRLVARITDAGGHLAGGQRGADALVDGLALALAGDRAELWWRTADGRALALAVAAVADGEATVEVGADAIDAIADDADGAIDAIDAMDAIDITPDDAIDGIGWLRVTAAGRPTGAVLVPTLPAPGERLTLAPVTAETTAEALATLALADRGPVELALIHRLVDAPLAAAALADDALPALTAALAAAAATHAAARAADPSPDPAPTAAALAALQADRAADDPHAEARSTPPPAPRFRPRPPAAAVTRSPAPPPPSEAAARRPAAHPRRRRRLGASASRPPPTARSLLALPPLAADALAAAVETHCEAIAAAPLTPPPSPPPTPPSAPRSSISATASSPPRSRSPPRSPSTSRSPPPPNTNLRSPPRSPPTRTPPPCSPPSPPSKTASSPPPPRSTTPRSRPTPRSSPSSGSAPAAGCTDPRSTDRGWPVPTRRASPASTRSGGSKQLTGRFRG
ncbi:MAG: hypothetical protein R3F65_11745 [bacterium]